MGFVGFYWGGGGGGIYISSSVAWLALGQSYIGAANERRRYNVMSLIDWTHKW